MILIEIGDNMSHVLAMLTGSPLGRHYVRAIMNLRARENREKRAKATPSSGIFYASAPTRRVTPRVPRAAKYRSLMVSKSHKKSIVAIAHKIICIIYFMFIRHSAPPPGKKYIKLRHQSPTLETDIERGLTLQQLQPGSSRPHSGYGRRTGSV